MNRNFYIEVNSRQRNHDGERICGDVFLYKSIKEEDRVIAVLSDGMGHGVKANILATLTSTMALNFTREHKEVDRIAEIIMNTLPVCSERKISYSTFTIVEIESSGKATILEYDNPQAIILRGSQAFDPGWNKVVLEKGLHAGKVLETCSFMPEKEDRIIFFSDGVAQSGMGSDAYPFGWERDNVLSYASKLVSSEASISAAMLAGMGLTESNMLSGTTAAPPATMSTTIVSPMARAMPRMTAVDMPERAAGMTIRTMVSYFVAPRA